MGKKSAIGNMPALGKRLKSEEITDIVNYLRTDFASVQLAKQTDAIRDLREWRLPASALDSERELELSGAGADHLFRAPVRISRASLFDVAGEERVSNRRQNEIIQRLGKPAQPELQDPAEFARAVARELQASGQIGGRSNEQE